MATLDEVAGCMKGPTELSFKTLSDRKVTATIKARLQSEDVATMSSSDSRPSSPVSPSQNHE